jgi:triosephosphate isomerase
VSSALVGVSLKTHLSLAQTVAWLGELRNQLAQPNLDLFICLPFPLLMYAVETLTATGIEVGSQDVSSFGLGAHTGEVTASIVADLGVRYAEVGHAERRIGQGETDSDIALKVQRCIEVGLTPVVCVGEERSMASPEASQIACAQLRRRLALLPANSSVVVAYEPEWAIGAASAADPISVCYVISALRSVLDELKAPGRILYGGSAAEGVYSALCNAASVTTGIPDGLFIGRAALDVSRLREIVDEIKLGSGNDVR